MESPLFEVEDEVIINNTLGLSGFHNPEMTGARGRIVDIDDEYIRVNFVMDEYNQSKFSERHFGRRRENIREIQFYFDESELDYFVGD